MDSLKTSQIHEKHSKTVLRIIPHYYVKEFHPNPK